MRPKLQGKNNLWRYRKRVELSQKRVAFLMGLKSVAQVSLWENGLKLPSLVNAAKLAYVLNTLVLELFPDVAAFAQHEVIRKREELLKKKR